MSENRAKSVYDINPNQVHSENSVLDIPDHQNMTQISHDLSQLEEAPYFSKTIMKKPGWDHLDNMTTQIKAIEDEYRRNQGRETEPDASVVVQCAHCDHHVQVDYDQMREVAEQNLALQMETSRHLISEGSYTPIGKAQDDDPDVHGGKYQPEDTTFTGSNYICYLLNPIFFQCCENQMGPQLKDEKDISDQLDKGTVLYFQSLKTFTILLFVLTLINTPLYWVYSANIANGVITKEAGADVFAYFSRANTYYDFPTSEFQGESNVTGIQGCHNRTTQMKEARRSVIYDQWDSSDVNQDGVLSQNEAQEFLVETGILAYGASLSNASFSGYDADNSTTVDKQEMRAVISQLIVSYPSALDVGCADENHVIDSVSISLKKSPAQECVTGERLLNHPFQKSYDDHISIYCRKQNSCTLSAELLKNLTQSLSCSCRNMAESVSVERQNVFETKIGCRHRPTLLNLPFGMSTSEYDQFEITNQMFMGVLIFIDLASLLTTLWFLSKLSKINGIRLQELRTSQPHINEYTLTISDYMLEETTQDIRILKMKLWLECYDFFVQQSMENEDEEDQEEVGNDLRILDINFNMTHYEYFAALKKMDIVRQQIEEETAKQPDTPQAENNEENKETTPTAEENDERTADMKQKMRTFTSQQSQFKSHFAPKLLCDENLLKRVPSEKQLRYHDKIFITFNKMSDLRKLKLENMDVSKNSIEPQNIRWTDLDAERGDLGATTKFLLGIVGSLLVQYGVCELTDQLGQYLIESHTQHVVTMCYRYIEALALVLLYKVFHTIWKNVVNQMQFPDEYCYTGFQFRASVVLGFTYLGVIPLISSLTGPRNHSGLSQEWWQRMACLYCSIVIWLCVYHFIRGSGVCGKRFATFNASSSYYFVTLAMCFILVLQVGVQIMPPIGMICFLVQYNLDKKKIFGQEIPKFVLPTVELAQKSLNLILLALTVRMILGTITIFEALFKEDTLKVVMQILLSSEPYKHNDHRKSQFWTYIAGNIVCFIICIFVYTCNNWDTKEEARGEDKSALEYMTADALGNLYRRAKFDLANFKNIFIVDKGPKRKEKYAFTPLSAKESLDSANKLRRKQMNENPDDITQQDFKEEMLIVHGVSQDEIQRYQYILEQRVAKIGQVIDQLYVNEALPIIVKELIHFVSDPEEREKQKSKVWTEFKQLSIDEKIEKLVQKNEPHSPDLEGIGKVESYFPLDGPQFSPVLWKIYQQTQQSMLDRDEANTRTPDPQDMTKSLQSKTPKKK